MFTGPLVDLFQSISRDVTINQELTRIADGCFTIGERLLPLFGCFLLATFDPLFRSQFCESGCFAFFQCREGLLWIVAIELGPFFDPCLDVVVPLASNTRLISSRHDGLVVAIDQTPHPAAVEAARDDDTTARSPLHQLFK